MKQSKLTLVILALALTVPNVPLGAQTEENLRRAIQLYENLQIEQARDMFLQVISPNSPFEVTTDQRVTAYLYLGAALASLSQPDSAIVFFRAAVERDPFADLDPQTFTQAERQVFAEAKQRSFRVGLRQIEEVRIDPRSESVEFDALTTHDGRLRLEINSVGRPLRFPIFEGDLAGLREINWSGELPQGGLVPSGTYELIATGISNLNRRVDSTRVRFSVTQEFEQLEDTLRTLRPQELLPERHPPSVATRELFMGIGVAVAALVIPPTLGSSSLEQPNALSISVAGAGALAGIFSFANRKSNPEIPANVAENARRRLERQQRNEEIRQRNAARLAETKLFFRPVAGAR